LLLTILLGLLQGLTEFLPISSSGHLVLAQVLLGVPSPGIVLEVVLHAGTLLAVLVAFRRDIWRMLRDTGCAAAVWRRHREPPGRGAVEVGLLALATLPVVAAGLLLRTPIESAFESPRIAAGLLMVTGLLLLATRWARSRNTTANVPTALAMGVMQVLSLLPGISRSGATISGGLFAGGNPHEMARFSFLMSVPAILGSLILEFPALLRAGQDGGLLPYAAGFLLAFASGLAAIRILLRVISGGRFFLFGFYCLVVGALAVTLLSLL
jgi:undecaprenyl-diphosphatase